MKVDQIFRWQLEKEVFFKAVRSRGPGGQNVNKVSSAAILAWPYLHSSLLSAEQKNLIQNKLYNNINSNNELYLRSDEFRDLEKNKSRCIDKLIIMLVAAFHKDKPRKSTKPTYSSKVKKLESKARRGNIKQNRKKVDW